MTEVPRGNPRGFLTYLKYDIISGFLVFLIALPLCLGISIASGFPPIAGVFTAIVGSIIASLISNSELTIKGPAAGLIVIVMGSVTSFTEALGDVPDVQMRAYQMALAVGFAAAIFQIAFGLLRAGILGDFFPTAVVHGMLAAIGVIIILKQLPVVFGEKAKGEPFEIIAEIPHMLLKMNPEIALIGCLSLLILFALPMLKKKWKHPLLQVIPGQLLVVLVSIPMGMLFDLSHEHTYTFAGHDYKLGEQFLVNVPGNFLSAMAHPDFSVFTNPSTQLAAIKWVVMFALIGSLESMLSAKAIDMIDPWKRKTKLNRDLVAVGIANLASASIGGLPMISEIVRSKANIDNGARTRFANLWHGMFLLAFVAFLPGLIHRIPLAALASMLVYTGFRLASPTEFINVYKIGREQFIIFVATIIAVLATDLLIGILIGIGLKFLIHCMNGVPLSAFFKPYLEVETLKEDTVQINALGSAVFTNWIPFRRQIDQLGLVQKNNLVINLAGAKFVDHSVMERLHEAALDFEQSGLKFDVIGLEGHRQFSDHPFAARLRKMTRIRRITIVTDASLTERLTEKIVELGATGYTAIPCAGIGKRGLQEGGKARTDQVRLETVVPNETSERILDWLRVEFDASTPITACAETVEVLRLEQF